MASHYMMSGLDDSLASSQKNAKGLLQKQADPV